MALPEGIHERVSRMLDAKNSKQATVRLTEAKSDLKDDAVANPHPSDHEAWAAIYKAAGERYKQRTDPEAVAARAGA